jgi:hypothetical protein
MGCIGFCVVLQHGMLHCCIACVVQGTPRRGASAVAYVMLDQSMLHCFCGAVPVESWNVVFHVCVWCCIGYVKLQQEKRELFVVLSLLLLHRMWGVATAFVLREHGLAILKCSCTGHAVACCQAAS